MKTPTRLLTALCLLTLLAACAVTPNPSLSNAAGSAQLAQGQDASVPDVAQGSRISGTVNLKGLGAAAGVEVKVYAAGSAPQMPHWTTRTDGAGRFEVAVPEGSYNVVVRQTGSNLAAARFGVQSGVVLDIDLVPTGRISGKVRLEPAASPVGVDVFVPGTGLMAKAGFDGGYLLENVPVGSYRVVAVRQGYGLVQSADVEVAAAVGSQVPELVLSTVRDIRTLVGKVTLSGADRRTAGEVLPDCWKVSVSPEATVSAEGVLVTVFNAEGEKATASTDVEGRYRIESFPVGSLTYHFEKAGYFDQWSSTNVGPFNPVGLGAGVYEFDSLTPLFAQALSIEPLPYALGIGQSYRLTTAYSVPQVGPYRDSTSFEWTSSEPAVLTVAKGVVTPLATGAAVVTVQDPLEPSRLATVDIVVQTFSTDGITAAVRMGADPFPADRRLFLQPAGSFPTSPVAVVAGLANPKSLCPGDYRLVWNRSARPGATVFPTPSPGGNPDPTADGLSAKVLDSYKSSVLQVPHANRGTPQAEVDISWDWPASGSAGPALEVEPGATFSVAFNPYPGADAYKLEVLDGGSVVQTSLATDSGVLEGTAPSAVGAFAYRLSFAEGNFGVGGFEGRTITYPLVAQSEFTSISSDSFVAIEPGTFVMGQEGITNATQSVTLTRGFYMQKTHVTQAQWQSLMGSNPSYFQGCPSCPVEQVSWFDAIEFANALSRRDGFPEVYNADGSLKSSDIYATSGYRLPTEAEWEYAYRAGTASTWYNGDDDQRVGDIGWFETNSGYRTRPVALKLPNAFGLFDMAGNVWQWVQDWRGDYVGSELIDPLGPPSGSARVNRGGSWDYGDGPSTLRAAHRDDSLPSDRFHVLGFRLARTMPGQVKPISSDSFAAIDPGTFVMGEPGVTNATQSVTLTRGFFMQKTHVTQEQWQALMGNNPSVFQGCGGCPVEQVSWFEAIEFANAMSRKDGFPEVYNFDGSLKTGGDIYTTTGYRLPTEAEWEYAYRAGTTTLWYNGDDESKVDEIAWVSGNSGDRTQPVAQKQPNAFGLYDMAGNVWQWTNDWYADYPGGTGTDPAGPELGPDRVIRGGSAVDSASFTKAGKRVGYNPESRFSSAGSFGFRLARTRP